MEKSTAKATQQGLFTVWGRLSSRWLSFKEISIGLILTTILINILGLTLPLFIYQVYDRVLPFAAIETLTVLAIMVGTLVISEAFLKLARQYVLLWGETKAHHDLATSAFEKIIQAHPAALQKSQAEKYLNLLQNSEGYKRALQYQTLTQCIDVPFIIIYLGIIASISLPLAAMLFTIQVGITAIGFLSLKHQERNLKSNQACKEQKNTLVNQMIEGIHTLKSLGMEAFYLRKFDQLTDKEIESHYALDKTQGQKNRLINIGSQLSIITVVAVGCLLVIQNSITLGALTACILLANRSFQPLQRWLEWYNQSIQQKHVANRLQAIYALPQEKRNFLAKQDVSGEISLSNVGSRDPLTGFWLIKDIDFTIAHGEVVAISSQNQAASSQLLKMMAGIAPPTQGHILMANQDLYGQNLYALRQYISYLPHNSTLFSGTILDNITMFRSKQLAREAQIIAQELGLAALIEALPMGYQTPVGFGASDHISRGIKQLIVIARGLLNNPQVLLFDEANTALDQIADKHLKNFLEKCRKHITIVIVSHRPSFLELADRTLVLDPVESPVTESSEVA